jgi:hypothetical protein
LLQAFTRKVAVVVKMDPITEELERGPDGLCTKVHSLRCDADVRLAPGKQVNYSSLLSLREQKMLQEHFKDIMAMQLLQRRNLQGMF